MDLVSRVKNILLNPKAEWSKIESEPGDAGWLFKNYVAIVAAIPPVCTFIGTTLIGIHGFRVGIFGGVIHAIVSYLLTFVGVYVAALVIDFLAQTFGAQRNFGNAMRVSSYAPTAAWVVGVFHLIPLLGVLAILGLYSLYLLHTGIAALMRPPADKALVYTIVTIVCMIVIWIVIAAIPALLIGGALLM
jgi:hypothetical protein